MRIIVGYVLWNGQNESQNYGYYEWVRTIGRAYYEPGNRAGLFVWATNGPQSRGPISPAGMQHPLTTNPTSQLSENTYGQFGCINAVNV